MPVKAKNLPVPRICLLCPYPTPPHPRTLCDPCRNRIFDENKDLAGWGLKHVARRSLMVRRIPPDDAFQAACEGLLEAIGRWEPQRAKLSTFSIFTIKKALQMEARYVQTVKLPSTVAKKYTRGHADDGHPWHKRVKAVLKTVSLDQTVVDDELTLLDALPDKSSPNDHPDLDRLAALVELVLLRANLTSYQLETVRRHFWDGMTMRDIGRERGRSFQGVSRCIETAISKLKLAYKEVKRT